MSEDDVPLVSRIARGEPRRYRTLSRTRVREPRYRRQLPIADLIGVLVKQHGLTDACRQRFVCLYWDEIAGPRIAPKTWPVSFANGVLHVAAITSVWVHELQFHKRTLVTQINAWVDANRAWLGPPPLVADLRFELGQRQRTPMVDREHVRRLHVRQLRRLRPQRAAEAPVTSEADGAAIRAETSAIDDAELRALVESVRVKWNR